MNQYDPRKGVISEEEAEAISGLNQDMAEMSAEGYYIPTIRMGPGDLKRRNSYVNSVAHRIRLIELSKEAGVAPSREAIEQMRVAAYGEEAAAAMEAEAQRFNMIGPSTRGVVEPKQYQRGPDGRIIGARPGMTNQYYRSGRGDTRYQDGPDTPVRGPGYVDPRYRHTAPGQGTSPQGRQDQLEQNLQGLRSLEERNPFRSQGRGPASVVIPPSEREAGRGDYYEEGVTAGPRPQWAEDQQRKQEEYLNEAPIPMVPTDTGRDPASEEEKPIYPAESFVDGVRQEGADAWQEGEDPEAHKYTTTYNFIYPDGGKATVVQGNGPTPRTINIQKSMKPGEGDSVGVLEAKAYKKAHPDSEWGMREERALETIEKGKATRAEIQADLAAERKKEADQLVGELKRSGLESAPISVTDYSKDPEGRFDQYAEVLDKSRELQKNSKVLNEHEAGRADWHNDQIKTLIERIERNTSRIQGHKVGQRDYVSEGEINRSRRAIQDHLGKADAIYKKAGVRSEIDGEQTKMTEGLGPLYPGPTSYGELPSPDIIGGPEGTQGGAIRDDERTRQTIGGEDVVDQDAIKKGITGEEPSPDIIGGGDVPPGIVDEDRHIYSPSEVGPRGEPGTPGTPGIPGEPGTPGKDAPSLKVVDKDDDDDKDLSEIEKKIKQTQKLIDEEEEKLKKGEPTSPGKDLDKDIKKIAAEVEDKADKDEEKKGVFGGKDLDNWGITPKKELDWDKYLPYLLALQGMDTAVKNQARARAGYYDPYAALEGSKYFVGEKGFQSPGLPQYDKLLRYGDPEKYARLYGTVRKKSKPAGELPSPDVVTGGDNLGVVDRGRSPASVAESAGVKKKEDQYDWSIPSDAYHSLIRGLGARRKSYGEY